MFDFINVGDHSRIILFLFMKTRPVSDNWLLILRSELKKKMTETFFLLFVRFAELFKLSD